MKCQGKINKKFNNIEVQEVELTKIDIFDIDKVEKVNMDNAQ